VAIVTGRVEAAIGAAGSPARLLVRAF